MLFLKKIIKFGLLLDTVVASNNRGRRFAFDLGSILIDQLEERESENDPFLK